MEYTVTWEIEVDADTAKAAARYALSIQNDPDSIATVFTVEDDRGDRARVDLTEDTVRPLDPDPLAQIAEILRDPEWGVGMLEDIAQIVAHADVDMRPRYRIAGPPFGLLVDYDENNAPIAKSPLDPALDLDQLLDAGLDAFWRQTGDQLREGYWTTRDRATVYRGEPDDFWSHPIATQPPDARGAEAVSTWVRH